MRRLQEADDGETANETNCVHEGEEDLVDHVMTMVELGAALPPAADAVARALESRGISPEALFTAKHVEEWQAAQSDLFHVVPPAAALPPAQLEELRAHCPLWRAPPSKQPLKYI